MATTSLSNRPSVGILYGFAEGALTGRKLRHSLRAAGFRVTKPVMADILIVHSGGFLLLPDNYQAKTIVYVGANTWHSPLTLSLRQKLRYELLDRKNKKQLRIWLLHGLRNDMYILKLPHTLRLLRGYRTKPSQIPVANQIIVIRNHHDPYCDEQSALKWKHVTSYIAMNGGHDDIWDNPDKYVAILHTIYGRSALAKTSNK